MKEEYSIGEISKIYKFSPETLRFYEKKGLVIPNRKENGYRVYSLQDIWRLNVIKGMRKLNFSLDSIADYLQNRSMEKEKELIQEEIRIIEEEFAPLLKQKEYLEKRLKNLEILSQRRDFGKIFYCSFPERKILRIQSPVKKDEEVDLAFRELERKNDADLILFSNMDLGALISKEDFLKGNYYSYQSVFCIVEEGKLGDGLLPQGFYATLYYKGSYKKGRDYYEEIIRDIKDKGYRIKGPVLELYRLDIHSTSKEEEYLTEIQIGVEKE